jgi:hypothetical protein
LSAAGSEIVAAIRHGMMHDRPAHPQTQEATMKNPLDSIGQTVLLGFVLTVVVVLLIHAIGA